MCTLLAQSEQLDRLAEIAIRIGVRVAEGQELIITAPIEALPLVRKITECAYRAGSPLVTTLFTDQQAILTRFEHAHDHSFDRSTGWLFEGMASAFRSGAARLAVIGEDPSLLSGQDPGKIARANRSRSVAYKPTLDLISSFSMNWSLVPYVTSSWAAAVFPQYPLDKAVTRLWQIVFAATRATEPDAVAAWNAHNGDLRARTSLLNGKRYSALHFRGPDTDLRVGLADGHKWAGGAAIARNGITCNTNIPTEEVFTAPHRSRVEGYVTSTRPLSYMGTTISDIRVRFEQGRIVEASAKRGSEIFQQLLEVDEGARRLGEVALVPCSSQISRSGILFHNTLFDENAASHLALGQSYSKCFIDGSDQEKDDFRARGANSSLMHVDWMIGSPDLQVDGLSEGGAIDPIMRSGEWTT